MKLFLTVALSLTMIALIAHAQQLVPPPYPPPPGPPSAGYSSPPPATGTVEIIPPQPNATTQAAPPPQTPSPSQQAVTPVVPPPQAPTPPQPPALQAQQQGNITFVSGGAGDEDRAALKQIESQYNLRLLFAARDGAYLANVGVTLADARGHAVLDTIADGPIFYARVPAGRYRLTVSNQGQSQSREITVSPRGVVHQDFYWAAG